MKKNPLPYTLVFLLLVLLYLVASRKPVLSKDIEVFEAPPSRPTVNTTPQPKTNQHPTHKVLATLPSGRTIDLYHFGAETTDILIIGAIHGSYEISAQKIVSQMITNFQNGKLAIPNNKGISLIPCMNPDGCALEEALYNGRFNANKVDLNRNWDAGWKQTAYLNDHQVNPGSKPFSEIETQTVRDYILASKPKITIFYHCCVDEGYVYLNGQAVNQNTFQSYLNITKFAIDPNKNVVGGDAIEYLDLPDIQLVGVEVEFPRSERTVPNYKLHLEAIAALLKNLP